MTLMTYNETFDGESAGNVDAIKYHCSRPCNSSANPLDQPGKANFVRFCGWQKLSLRNFMLDAETKLNFVMISQRDNSHTHLALITFSQKAGDKSQSCLLLWMIQQTGTQQELSLKHLQVSCASIIAELQLSLGSIARKLSNFILTRQPKYTTHWKHKHPRCSLRVHTLPMEVSPWGTQFSLGKKADTIT